jgi:hypothetical protein
MEKRTKCVRNHPTRSKEKSKKIKKENKESKNPKPKKRT